MHNEFVFIGYVFYNFCQLSVTFSTVTHVEQRKEYILSPCVQETKKV